MSVLPALRAKRGLRILRRPSESIRPAAPRPQRRDCHGRLASALLALAGEGARLADAGFRPWCSATFIGAQHRFAIELPGADARERAEQLSRILPEAELMVPGHIVADVTVDAIVAETGSAVRLVLAALTVEDW